MSGYWKICEYEKEVETAFLLKYLLYLVEESSSALPLASSAISYGFTVIIEDTIHHRYRVPSVFCSLHEEGYVRIIFFVKDVINSPVIILWLVVSLQSHTNWSF